MSVVFAAHESRLAESGSEILLAAKAHTFSKPAVSPPHHRLDLGTRNGGWNSMLGASATAAR